MSRIYLVRHGQAGTRDAYDELSALGLRQSRLLGEYFVTQGIGFAAAYTGTLRRQQQTAQEVGHAYAQARAAFPQLQVNEEWNEFDLGMLYEKLAPHLAAEDVGFRRQYATLSEQLRNQAGTPDAPVHRQWQPCDSTLVEAWITGRFPFHGESWQQFRNRITGCRHLLCEAGPEENLLVFTSALPIGIWTGLALDTAATQSLRLAGVLYNTAYTIVRATVDDLRLFTFNAIPHLVTAELRTHR